MRNVIGNARKVSSPALQAGWVKKTRKGESTILTMSDSVKINVITIIGILLIVICIPVAIISDMLNIRLLTFLSETILLTVFPLIFIYYLLADKTKFRKIILVIKAVLLVLFLCFAFPSLLQRYFDIPSLISRNYSYNQGEAVITMPGVRTTKFSLNGINYSVENRNFDSILSKGYKPKVKVKVWYLPNSKYVMDIK